MQPLESLFGMECVVANLIIVSHTGISEIAGEIYCLAVTFELLIIQS